MFKKTFRLLVSLALLVGLQAAPLAPVARAANTSALMFTVPVATSFSTYVPANRQTAIALQGSDAEGTALTYAIASGPSHGALSGLNTFTGAVVYTPVDGYTGADSFTYTVTSGGETSAPGTVTLTVTNQKTRIVDTLTNASGAPRIGKVTFILTQAVASPGGLIPAGASVSATVNSAGTFDASVFPSKSLSPQAYYQVYFSDATTLNRELLGIYEIPFSTSTVSLAPYKVLDTNLAARYTFASAAAVEALTTAVSTATLAQLLAGGSIASLNITGQVTAGSIHTAGSVTAASANVGGTVTAARFVGDISGATGLSIGPGSVSNAGSTTQIADNDNNGTGKHAWQIGPTEYLGLENGGYLSGKAIENSTGSINVRQLGAVPDDGGDDATPVLNTINAAISSGRPKTIRFPTGVTEIKSTVTKALGPTYDLVFQGDGSGSIIRLATGGSADGFVIAGGSSIVFRDLTFVGTTGVQDVRYGLKFDDAKKVRFENCSFYGLASASDLILANLSYLELADTRFFGCAADGSFNFGIVNNTNWRGIKVTDSQFFDYGELNGVNYTKGGIGFPYFWIRVGPPRNTLREVISGSDPGTQSVAGSQGEATILNSYFDEGAGYGVLGFSDIGGGSPMIERILIKGCNFNVTQAGGAGANFYGTNWVNIESSWFGYVYLSPTNALVLNGAGHVTLRNVIMAQKAATISVITPTAGSTQLTIIDSVYQNVFLQVSAQIDITQGGKRRLKTYGAGDYSFATLSPIYDLEMPTHFSLGGEVTWTRGIGAPVGPCSVGSFYSQLDGGPGSTWYVCEGGGVWAAK